MALFELRETSLKGINQDKELQAIFEKYPENSTIQLPIISSLWHGWKVKPEYQSTNQYILLSDKNQTN